MNLRRHLLGKGGPRATGSRQRGIALMEFAVTLPLFLVLLLGMMEYGYYFYVAVSATNAAREGARQCTLTSLGACGNCNPTAAVAYMNKIGMASNTNASASCATNAGTFMYTVNVAVDFPTLTGFPPVVGAMPASSSAGNTMAWGVAVMRGQ
jgi:Flp pilus assembly protein TadG